jgi:hypothetical protein
LAAIVGEVLDAVGRLRDVVVVKPLVDLGGRYTFGSRRSVM